MLGKYREPCRRPPNHVAAARPHINASRYLAGTAAQAGVLSEEEVQSAASGTVHACWREIAAVLGVPVPSAMSLIQVENVET
jgi:hypothetical protein